MTTQDKKEYPEGSFSCLEFDYQTGKYKPLSYVLYKTHKGLCLQEFEKNYYDDSDFFMVVWNPEKQAPETVEFATTRAWCYPCLGSKVDATEEVKKAYSNYIEKEKARHRLEIRKAKKNNLKALKQAFNDLQENYQLSTLEMIKLRKLRKHLPSIEFKAICNLFSSKIRSQFKLKLRNQTLSWIKANQAKYNVPLSKRQLSCLVQPFDYRKNSYY